MKTTNFGGRNSWGWVGTLYCLALVFCFAFAGCTNEALWNLDRLEKKALKYGTISVGAVRVIPYDSNDLEKSRENLHTALETIRCHLTKEPITAPQQLSDAAEDSGKARPPQTSEIENIGLRMAALKFVESELEDINLKTISPNEPNFSRVVISLDCSAWVRGKAGAALVYIDLYPYRADGWCHEAAKILECWRNGDKVKDIDNCKELEGIEHYKCCWNTVIEKKLQPTFKSSDLSARVQMPKKSDIEKRNPNDWVACCHGWLEKKKLLPHIVHVERIGKAEYLILAESDYSSSKFGIGFEYPAGPSAEWEAETRTEAKRRMGSLRQLSLAFMAGNRRAGWLFMPGKTTEGKMAPTERRLRMVVDVPKELETLAIHVHKGFLGPDLGVLDGATFSKQSENLKKTRETLTKTDKLYEKYIETKPRHYRLVKSRMRNLLHQGYWSEEIPVTIPKK